MPDPRVLKFVIYLAIIYISFFVTGSLAIPGKISSINLSEFLLTLSFFFIVNLTLIWVFFKGLIRNPKKAILSTFSLIVSKFLVYLVFILVYYLITKNLTLEYLIVFFVLYLAFTFYTLYVLIQILKQNHYNYF